jgi:hypothetical protein
MKINSIFGEPLCVTDLDQPLPYSWKLVVDDSEKILQKLDQSLKVLKSIQERNPTKTILDSALFPQSDNGLSLD